VLWGDDETSYQPQHAGADGAAQSFSATYLGSSNSKIQGPLASRFIRKSKLRKWQVSTLEERDIDSLLLVVSLLGRYEGARHCTSDDIKKSLQSSSHLDEALVTGKF
jgi:hypothetical protein